MNKITFIALVFLLFSCSKQQNKVKLLCKEKNDSKAFFVTVDFVNKTLAMEKKRSNDFDKKKVPDYFLNVGITENKISWSEVENNDSGSLTTAIILDRRSLLIRSKTDFEAKDGETSNWSDVQHQCEVFKEPERKI